MAIKEIAFTGVPVVDATRARAFYEGVLGLTPTLELMGGLLVEYRLGGGTLTIGCLGDAWKPSEHGPFVALEVDSLDEETARLESHGVTFTLKAQELPTSRFAVLHDPDGNTIMIHERKKV